MAHTLPGIGSTTTATPRSLFLTYDGVEYLRKNLIIDGTLSRDPDNTGDVDVLRAGIALTHNPTDNKYASTILGTVDSAYTGEVSLTLTTQCATEVVRRIGSTGTEGFLIVGPDTSIDDAQYETANVLAELVTYSAVNVSTGVVTVTALSNNYAVGSWIIGTQALRNSSNVINDGTEPLLYATLLLGEEYGIKVTDDNDASQDAAFAKPVIAGQVDTNRIVNYPTDRGMQLWLKRELRNDAIGLSFSDDF